MFKKVWNLACEMANEVKQYVSCKIDNVKRVTAEIVVGGMALTAAGSSFAVGPDLTTVTAAVDFGTVTTAVLGVAAALIVVYIAWKGARMVISAVRGG